MTIEALNEALNDPIFKGITNLKEGNEGLSQYLFDVLDT